MEWTCLFVQLLKKLPLDGYERPLWCRLLQAVKERRVFREEPTLPCEGSSEFPAQTSTTSHLTLLQPPDWMRPGSGWPARVEAVALSSRKSECFTRQKKRKLRKKEAAVIVLPPPLLLLLPGGGAGETNISTVFTKNSGPERRPCCRPVPQLFSSASQLQSLNHRWRGIVHTSHVRNAGPENTVFTASTESYMF